MQNKKISVIIPFFQEEKDILRKAILSVLRQKNVDNYEIIVVDDGSPLPAEKELSDLLKDKKYPITIIKQKNAGPAAARNKGLDAASKDTVYVAFLDSDDEWSDSHLNNAIYALEMGYDFYFAYAIRVSGFERLRAPTEKGDFGKHFLERHSIIDKERGLYQLEGDLFDIILEEFSPRPPTVVYRFEKFRNLRFDERLFNSEDKNFFLILSQHTKKIVFSKKLECFCGDGVNILCKSQWDSPTSTRCIYNEFLSFKIIMRDFSLNPYQIKLIKKQINDCRISFVASALHDIRKYKKTNLTILIKQLMLDWQTVFVFSFYMFKLIFKKLNIF